MQIPESSQTSNNFSTGGRSFLICSIILFLVATATFVWVALNASDMHMHRYMLYTSSLVFVTLGLVVFSAFAFKSPKKASKYLWISLGLALLSFAMGLLSGTDILPLEGGDSESSSITLELDSVATSASEI